MDISLFGNFNEKNLDDYIVKVTKPGPGVKEEIVVEKKSFWSFFGKYIYSGRYTYNLDKIKDVLERALAEKPPNPQLNTCQAWFNKEVTEYNNSWWAKIFGTTLKTIDVAQAIFQPSQPRIPELLAKAQEATLAGNIPQAAQYIEGHLKQINKKSEQEVDICQGFDIQDDSIGDDPKNNGLKGIRTIDSYNKGILLADDEDPKIHTSTDLIKDQLLQYPNGFMFFRKSDETFHIFRLDNEKVQIYSIHDQGTKSWVDCSDEILQSLKLQPTDLCVCLGAPILEETGTVHAAETREDKRVNNYFYQESQGPNSGSFCAIHAANAFLGYRAIGVPSLYSFARPFLLQSLKPEKELLYRCQSEIGDVRKGADAGVLKEYFKHLAATDPAFKDYTSLKIIENALLLKRKESDVQKNGTRAEYETMLNMEAINAVSQSSNRIIVGWGAFHFITLRKDTENNRWYIIDSMRPDSQDNSYSSLTDVIKKLAENADAIKLIYAGRDS